MEVFSPQWHLVAQGRPRLRNLVTTSCQKTRLGERFFLRDPVSGKFHYIDIPAWQLLSLMNGQNTLEEIWHKGTDLLKEDMLSQTAIISLLQQLHRAQLLTMDQISEAEVMMALYRREKRQQRLMQWLNPMGIKIPLVNPEKFLTRTESLSFWLFSRLTLVMMLALWAVALVQMVAHWEPLTASIKDQLFSIQNGFIMLLVYPVVKLIHELSHAYAVKRWGGEVAEIGLMFLVFYPVPYVDASAASSFRHPYQRVLVALAGIMAELTMAAIAVLLWIYTESGVLRAVWFSVLVISGSSTLLFNGNPLLRFDGYFALADALRIPNMAQLAQRYLGYWARRYLLWLPGQISPVKKRRLGIWLWSYGLSSFCYRMMISLGIAWYVADSYPLLGTLLAVWAMTMSMLVPLVKTIQGVRRSIEFRREPKTYFMRSSLWLGVAFSLLLFLPLPHYSSYLAVYELDEKERVVPQQGGWVAEILIDDGEPVQEGEPVIRLESSELQLELTLVEKQLAVARIRSLGVKDSPVAVQVVRETVVRLKKELQELQKRKEQLLIRTATSGVFYLPERDSLIGAWLDKGMMVGAVLEQPRIRALVDYSTIDLVRSDLKAAAIRPIQLQQQAIEIKEITVTPAASRQIISPGLVTSGGGQVEVDASQDPPQLLKPHFMLTAELPEALLSDMVGVLSVNGHLWLRLQHSPRSLASRLWRAGNQELLRLVNR